MIIWILVILKYKARFQLIENPYYYKHIPIKKYPNNKNSKKLSETKLLTENVSYNKVIKIKCVVDRHLLSNIQGK